MSHLVAILAAALVAAPEYQAEIASWRAKREARLKAEGGWLSVAGLYWLKEGRNRFGTAADNEIVLPRGSAPEHAGAFELKGEATTLTLEPGVEATIADKPVTGETAMRDDAVPDGPDVLKLGRRLTLQVIKRQERRGIRMKDAEAPTRRAFKGLQWYPVKGTYRVTARWIPYDPPHQIPVPSILGTVSNDTCPGVAVFSLAGKELRLEPILETPDAKELFFIFRDLTSAHETYGGGRFLYAEMPADGTVVLDFNKAYSPPCAFTAYATCPLPPAQNRLDVRLEAGERFSGHHPEEKR